MHRSNPLHVLVLCVAAAAASLALTGCQGCSKPLAIVAYDQVGACDGLSNLQGAGPNLAFVFFRLTGIDNTKTTIDFNFKPNKLYLNTGDMYSSYNWVVTGQYSLALGLTPAKASLLVTHGMSVNLNNYVVFLVQTTDPDGAKEANNTSYFLLYSTDASDPGEVLVKNNSSQKAWPYTQWCSQIQFPK